MRRQEAERRAVDRRERALKRASRSIGHPWQGRLEGGVRLEATGHVRYVSEYAAGGNFFGTYEFVRLIERAAAVVDRRVPGSMLSVGELSHPRGREIDGHGSHESGRDADVSFYMLDGAGQPYLPGAFANFARDGKGTGPNANLRFDDARNWEFVARMVADPETRVQYMFVANTLRERLLAEGRRRRAPANVLERAAAVLVQPAQGHPHRNHFHVRVYCDPSDRPGCKDRYPFWPWYPGTRPAN